MKTFRERRSYEDSKQTDQWLAGGRTAGRDGKARAHRRYLGR